MKYIVFLFIILLPGVSCNNTPAKTQPVKETDAREKNTNPALTLTDEQIKAIGLKTGNVEQRNLKTMLKVNGKLTLPPQKQAQVSILTGGIVSAIKVNEGNFVQQGQPLAVLQTNEVIQLQQDYGELRSQLKYLEAEYQRQKELQKDNINAAKTFQQAENELEVAKARQKGLRAKLQLLGIQPDNPSAANFTGDITIAAPISGYIHHIYVTMGKYADANAVLFEIVDNRYLHLDLTVFEKDIHKLQVGQKIAFTDANDPTHIHPATIYSLDKAFQSNQQAITAHARIEEATETLLPGMYVEARIQIDKYQANALPDDAVVNDGDDHYIYMEINKNQYRQTAVKIGARDMGYTEILPLEDVPPGARIVTHGAYYLLSEASKGSGAEK